MPSFTFVSTINAFALRGARPVFADIREDTLNLDKVAPGGPDNTDRPGSLLPVPLGGVGCQMDTIRSRRGTPVVSIVEDNAHGSARDLPGPNLWGHSGVLSPTQSFHETKNFTCGEGGALVINEPRTSSSGPRS